MFASISVLDDDIHNLKLIDDEAKWTIRFDRSGIGPKTNRRNHSGHQGWIICDLIEHRTICTIVHCVKGNFELDCFGGDWLSDNFEWNESNIVYIMILVDSSRRCERCRRVVGDGSSNI
jgi:hypothetical protein